jgi:methylase of polypeptide subunit release factors
MLQALPPRVMVETEAAFLQLLAELRSRNYHFTCVTPATHTRVVARPLPGQPSLSDIFGWSRRFDPADLAPELLEPLKASGCLERIGSALRSTVRVATVGDQLFLHSAFPTTAADSVFFGPDTYRFIRYVQASLRDIPPPKWIVDLGAGSGAGGIWTAAHLAGPRLTLVDINPAAARLARLNARFAGIPAEVLVSPEVPSGCDLVIANPPYMMDPLQRAYRNGGSMLGGEIAHRWTRQALESLRPGGTLLLYTGAAFAAGNAPAIEEIAALCRAAGARMQVDELDPDVFGEDLEKPAYRCVERIAAMGLSITAA